MLFLADYYMHLSLKSINTVKNSIFLVNCREKSEQSIYEVRFNNV